MSHDPGPRSDDWLYRLFAWLESFTPNFVYAWVAQHVLGAERAARVVSFLPAASLPRVVGALPVAFSAAVAPHLNQEGRTKLVQALTIETLVEVTRALFVQKDYETAARFGELMTPSQVKALVVAQNDPEGMAHTAQYYDPAALVRVAQAFSGPYLTRLAAALDRSNYHKLEADLGVALPVENVSALMKGLAPAQAVRFLMRCSEDRLNEVLSKLSEEKRNTIMQAMLNLRVAHLQQK